MLLYAFICMPNDSLSQLQQAVRTFLTFLVFICCMCSVQPRVVSRAKKALYLTVLKHIKKNSFQFFKKHSDVFRFSDFSGWVSLLSSSEGSDNAEQKQEQPSSLGNGLHGRSTALEGYTTIRSCFILLYNIPDWLHSCN